ncbi:hypothetical protein WICPIJ_002126 [Wickerhamomyces pijperi]|uniref:SWIRM domain-containing protein n=1 Tax=Wickerhamomyces pijperi TaxID=599730 RepID=A0A9P8QC11_WICPI|nr:hypothetical protein WICPIJ_002126 [Wickerhamomyces pijperi]
MSSSTELNLGTMTPEFGNNAVLCGDFSSEQAALNFQLLRKPSKSSVDLSIPSPPLSPCPSSANSKEDFIDFDTSDLPASPTPISSRGSKRIEAIVVLPKYGTDLKEFPLDNFDQKFPMAVNAWSGINSRGFIRQQLDFLNQYKLRTNKVSKNYTYGNASHNRKMAPRRVVRTFYNEQSDSDSQFEKVRTRRVVRDSSLPVTSDLETTPASISRPSTPTIKRVRRVVSSPTPQPLNIDWESLPDFSPDVSALPANNTRCLKVEWKGQPMNLSDDPLVDKLHPAEVTLASILRLPCNLYLDSKRRLFMEKVARLKKGLPFRRTDAQKSCRIDVNKASRLFAAFEKIGWLNDDQFGKYLRN